MMPDAPTVSIVIPVLDPGPMLFDCLASVGPESEDVEVILFDNGSADGMAAKATQLYPKIRVLRSETNTGFAPASNRGAEAATGRYLLFLNSDAVLAPGGRERLVEIADHDPEAAVWQPVIMSPGGAVENGGDYFSWSGFFIRRRSPPPRGAAPYPVFACTAACMLMRRDVFTDLGGFQDEYFAYIEDVDLCWRARLAGWEARVVPSVSVVHKKRFTTRRVLAPSAVRYITFRNRLRTILSNGSVPLLVRVLPIHVAICVATAIALAILGRGRSAVAVASALIWPLTHRKELAAQRQDVRSIRKRSDHEVVRDVSASLLSGDGRHLLHEHIRTWSGP